MRVILLVVVALVVAGQMPHAQTALPPNAGNRTGGPSFKIGTQPALVDMLIYDSAKQILITKAMDPQTVLCIEHQDGPKLSYIWGSVTTQPATGAQTVTVPEAPKLPERTCHTVAQWLEKDR